MSEIKKTLEIKKKLLDKMNSRIASIEKIRERKKTGNIVHDYVSDFIKLIEEFNDVNYNQAAWETLITFSILSLESQIKTIDAQGRIEVKWSSNAEGVSYVDGVLIRWSDQYQKSSGCEPELFIDAISCFI